jgi:hypothetical protein
MNMSKAVPISEEPIVRYRLSYSPSSSSYFRRRHGQPFRRRGTAIIATEAGNETQASGARDERASNNWSLCACGAYQQSPLARQPLLAVYLVNRIIYWRA